MKDRWIEALRQDPHGAVADLFNGRAGVAFETRLDVPELLCRWFPKGLEDDRNRLDDALLWWLRDMQRSYTSTLDRLGFPVYSKRICDALIALQLLDLPGARAAIRSELTAWLRWLAPLRLASGRDPTLECYRLLTQGQQGTGHMAAWLRLAADLRPEYLTVALAGLRRLPNDGDARQNQMLMLQALLRHAVVRFHDVDGARHFFNRRFAAVRGLFPRAPDHWKGVLDDALRGFENINDPLAAALAADLGEKHMAKGPAKAMHRRRPRAVPHEVWRSLQHDIVNAKQPADTLAQRLFGVLEQNHDYASAAGDSDPFVRTLSSLGSKLLVNHWLSAVDLARFGVMIERGLVWEPANPYCWTLWAKWFQTQGRKDAQEAVLRETLRLFPRNEAAQVELARLLIVRGEEWWNEAEHHLRRTIDEHPDNSHAHVVLARLFVLREQPVAAEKMLAAFSASHPDNSDVRKVHEDLRSGEYTPTVRADKYELSDRRTTSAPYVTAPLTEVLRRGSLAVEFNRARIAHDVNGQTKLIEQEREKGDALAGFYSQWLHLPDTPDCPPHAWAWNACLHWQESSPVDAWEELAKRFPESVSETYFLRMLALPHSSNGNGAHHPHTRSGAMSRPVDMAMRDWWEVVQAGDLDRRQREDIACQVMACAAANAPEFVAATVGVERPLEDGTTSPAATCDKRRPL